MSQPNLQIDALAAGHLIETLRRLQKGCSVDAHLAWCGAPLNLTTYVNVSHMDLVLYGFLRISYIKLVIDSQILPIMASSSRYDTYCRPGSPATAEVVEKSLEDSLGLSGALHPVGSNGSDAVGYPARSCTYA